MARKVEISPSIHELSLIDLYRADVTKIARLSPEEESEMMAVIQALKVAKAERKHLESLQLPIPDSLTEQIEAGEEIRKKFVASHLRLAWYFAGKYTFDESNMLDLIQAANLALLSAVDLFNPDLNFQFSTYASVAIKRILLRKGLLEIGPIKLNEGTYLKIQTMKKLIGELEQEFGRTPTVEEISMRLGLTEEEVIELYYLMQQPIELDEPLGDEANGDDISSIFIDHHSVAPDVPIHQKELRAAFQRVLENYPDQFKRNKLQKEVLGRLYGIYADTQETFAEIASQLGVTEGEAKRLADEAISIIKRQPGNLELLAKYL